MTKKISLFLLLCLLWLTACSSAAPAQAPAVDAAGIQQTQLAGMVAQTLAARPTETPLPTITPTPTQTLTPTLAPTPLGGSRLLLVGYGAPNQPDQPQVNPFRNALMDLEGNIRFQKDLIRTTASVSPDGNWIAYGTETGLELTDLDGNSQSLPLQTLNTSSGDLRAFWFPDGQRLVLLYNPGLIHSIYPEAIAYTLAILNRADGSVVTLASDVSRVSEPSFALSPDGSWILYRRRDGVNYRSATDGSRTDALPAMGGAALFFWSPDGSMIYWTQPQGNNRLWRSGSDGSNPEVVASQGYIPSWGSCQFASSGSAIACANTLIDMNQTPAMVKNLVNLAPPDGRQGFVTQVFVSPDQTQALAILMYSDPGVVGQNTKDHWLYYLVNLQTGETRPLTSEVRWNESGQIFQSPWSPDGKMLAIENIAIGLPQERGSISLIDAKANRLIKTITEPFDHWVWTREWIP